MNFLITGGAGFIGFHISKRLLNSGHTVTIFDSFDEMTGKQLKFDRIKELRKRIKGTPAENNLTVIYDDILRLDDFRKIMSRSTYDQVIHLAALPGIGPSFLMPERYHKVNVEGTANVLQLCNEFRVGRVFIASSSSVYSGNDDHSQSEYDQLGLAANPYGRSKQEVEELAEAWTSETSIPAICLRFFTNYGPWSRPDMAFWKFTELLINQQPVTLHVTRANREVVRDFTHVEDTACMVEQLTQYTGYSLPNVLNVTTANPQSINTVIRLLGLAMAMHPIINIKQLPAGEVERTFGTWGKLSKYVDMPYRSFPNSVREWVTWFMQYQEDSKK